METSKTVLVMTQNGPVRGRQRETAEDIPFVSFHGIPYAKPPTGNLRFKAPKPIDNWTDVLDATKKSNVACQIHFITYEYDTQSNEDCLQLNVYTKSVNTSTLCPVMVWIHGGGYMMGSTDESIYAPDFLLRKDIVLVTISYRLGPFGFLSVDDPKYEIPGNAGLKDQSLGLRWVQANIDRFGGDPNNVTLFGESAGSTSVNCHLLSEHSKGLFHRAIMQSGSAFAPFGLQPKANQADLLAKRLGWDGEGGSDAMMQVLLNADSKSITVNQRVLDEHHVSGGKLMYAPCIEPYGDETTAFFRKPYNELTQTAWGNTIPLLIGCNSDEGKFAEDTFPQSLTDYDGFFSTMIPHELDMVVGSEKSIELGRKIRDFYYDTQIPSWENREIFTKILTDRFFWRGSIEVIRNRLLVAAGAPTYLYRFSFSSIIPAFWNGVFMAGWKKSPGCWHAEELVYLFRQHSVYNAYELSGDSYEASVISRFIDIWTSFSRTGNPNCDELNGLDWAPVKTIEPYKCLHLATNTEIIDLPEWERLAFWESLKL